MNDAGLVLRVTEVPLERLEAEIMSWSGDLAAATAKLLRWVGEYDRREGWKTWGSKSCADWLSWKCGDSLHTGREKVRVARALQQLPATAAAFGSGELSYSKVRAITRVACVADDAEWVVQARHSTGAQLDRIVAGVRRALDVNENRDAGVALGRRRMTKADCGGGESVLKGRLPTDMAATVMAALDVLATQMIDEAVAGSGRSRRDVIADRGGMEAVRVDALVQMAEQTLAANPAAAERGDVGRLQLVVDSETLKEVEQSTDAAGDAAPEPDSGESTLGGRRVAPEIARRWACDIRAAVSVDHDGHGCDQGRETRVLNRRMRRALNRRDNGACRFPGCGASSWLHAHHIVHWADGGPTDLDNLVSLCGYHHRLIHEGGWEVALIDGAVVWSDADGIPTTIEPLAGDAEALRESQRHLGIAASSIESNWHNDRLDFNFVVAVISENCLRARRRTTQDVPAGTSPADSVRPPSLRDNAACVVGAQLAT